MIYYVLKAQSLKRPVPVPPEKKFSASLLALEDPNG